MFEILFSFKDLLRHLIEFLLFSVARTLLNINDNGIVKVPIPQYNSNKSSGFSMKSITLNTVSYTHLTLPTNA